MYCFNDTISTE